MDSQPARAVKGDVLPYRPSWADGLTAWIDRLPLPAWLFYLLFLLLMVFANNARQWIDGTAPLGTVALDRTADAFYSVYFLALIHYLNRVARRAFGVFRPLLDVDDQESRRLEYALTVLPAGAGYVALLGGGLLALGGILLDPHAFGLTAGLPAFAWGYVVVVAAFNTAVLIAFVLHGIRQLRLIDRLYARAGSLNLLTPAPLYAFSAVTARTGLGVVFFAWFMIVQDPTPGLNPVSILGVATLMLLGIASFVLPLMGIHERLVGEKQRLRAQVGSRLTATFALLHASVDTGDLAQSDKIFQAVASLKAEQEMLDALPTWPWRPEMPRLFVTAVILPVVVWIFTSLLERLLAN